MDNNHRELPSDAQTQSPSILLQSAARLIERALIQLDLSEAPCPCCDAGQFYNLEEARVYEQLSDTPTKLRHAAARVAHSLENGRPKKSSRGWAEATAQHKQKI